MSTTQLRQRFHSWGRATILGVAALALTIAYAGPSFTNGSGQADTTLTPRATAAEEVAWRGRGYYRRGYRRAYRPPYYRNYYRNYYRGSYGPRYYGRPYGGAVITPYGGVYW
ncbi:MAG: hypothetical protein ACIALR_10035 [Blastopirellula sp. JB062]